MGCTFDQVMIFFFILLVNFKLFMFTGTSTERIYVANLSGCFDDFFLLIYTLFHIASTIVNWEISVAK